MGPAVKVRYYDAEATIGIDSPNVTLGEILVKAKAALSIPTGKTNLELQYKHKPLDLLLPFRLSGILSNSTVDIVETVRAPGASSTAAVGSANPSTTSNEKLIAIALDFGQQRPRVEGNFAPHNSLKDIFAVLGIILDEWRVRSARFMNRRIELAQFDSTTLQSLGLTSGSALIRVESAPNTTSAPPPVSNATSVPSQPERKPPSTEGNAMDIEEEKTKEFNSASLSQELQQCIPNVNECQIAVLTLMKILRNVYVNPKDEKVRTLRMSNPTLKAKLKDAPPCFRLLVSAGFAPVVRDGDTWFVRRVEVELDRLELAFNQLSRCADDLNIPSSDRPSLSGTELKSPAPASSVSSTFEFDPFKTNVIGMSGTNAVRFDSSGGDTKEQQVQQLKNKKEAMLKGAGITVDDRKLVAIAYSSDFNPRRFLAAEEEEDDQQDQSREDYDADERAVIAQHQKAVHEKQKKAENFQTKAMREYEQLLKTRVYTRTLIRITFPDRSVLQGLFSPLETVGSVSEVICSVCPLATLNDFALLTGPPPQRLDPSVTLESLGLYPAASLQLTSSNPERLMIRQELFSTDPTLINVRVPKGEPLVPRPATARPSVASGSKPKWLKL